MGDDRLHPDDGRVLAARRFARRPAGQAEGVPDRHRAILEASFIPADRARAIGAWSGLSGVAIAAGPLIGGYLISAASWRWIFFINVPIAAVVVALGARHVPESRDPGATGKLDYAGALSAAGFLSGMTFAFIEAPALG
jgi:MFS family permease